MSTHNSLAKWDTAMSEFLDNRRALGRAYKNEEYVLKNVRAFLEAHEVDDLDDTLFDNGENQRSRSV